MTRRQFLWLTAVVAAVAVASRGKVAAEPKPKLSPAKPLVTIPFAVGAPHRRIYLPKVNK